MYTCKHVVVQFAPSGVAREAGDRRTYNEDLFMSNKTYRIEAGIKGGSRLTRFLSPTVFIYTVYINISVSDMTSQSSSNQLSGL